MLRNLKNPLAGPIRFDLRGHCISKTLGLIATAMYIATRRARLEAREAEFLVFDNETKKNMVSNWATFTNKKFLKEGVKNHMQKRWRKLFVMWIDFEGQIK